MLARSRICLCIVQEWDTGRIPDMIIWINVSLNVPRIATVAKYWTSKEKRKKREIYVPKRVVVLTSVFLSLSADISISGYPRYQ